MKLALPFLAVPALALCLTTGGCDAPKPAPGPTPAPTPASTPAPAPAATPAPTAAPVAAEPLPKYDGQQQSNYIQQAGESFVDLRTAKSQPFVEANNALEGAGGLSAKGLTSKEAVAARRQMLANAQKTNEEYRQFVATQVDTYKAELAKTPLTPADVDSITQDFAGKANTAKLLKLRTDEGELLKTGDAMLAQLESGYGTWTVNGPSPRFKKPADQNAYAALQKKYNTLAVDMQKVRAEVNAKPSPAASPGVSPAAAGAGATPVAAPTAAVP